MPLPTWMDFPDRRLGLASPSLATVSPILPIVWRSPHWMGLSSATYCGRSLLGWSSSPPTPSRGNTRFVVVFFYHATCQQQGRTELCHRDELFLVIPSLFQIGKFCEHGFASTNWISGQTHLFMGLEKESPLQGVRPHCCEGIPGLVVRKMMFCWPSSTPSVVKERILPWERVISCCSITVRDWQAASAWDCISQLDFWTNSSR